MRNVLFAGAVAVALLTGSVAPATAALVMVTDRSSLGANDSVDWGQLGTPFYSVDNPFSATSNLGTPLTGSIKGGLIQRLDQGNGWSGTFANGDELLSVDNVSLLLDFSSAVMGGGAQIQVRGVGAFKAQIQAFDASGTSLGLFEVAGTSALNFDVDPGQCAGDIVCEDLINYSNSHNDMPAIFIGVKSDTANIDKISFSFLPDKSDFFIGLGAGFAINQLSLVTTQVAEPESLGLLTAGLFCLWWYRRRKQDRQWQP